MESDSTREFPEPDSASGERTSDATTDNTATNNTTNNDAADDSWHSTRAPSHARTEQSWMEQASNRSSYT